MRYHVPVLLNESIKGLSIKPNGTYLDLTFGGGGHSRSILKKLIKVRKKYNVHDEDNKYKNGDKVSIIESKPFSKNKKFQVMENSK